MAADTGWLFDGTRPLTPSQLDQIDRGLADDDLESRGGGRGRPTLAVSVHDVIVHNNRKWFGEADVRLDALVVTGYGSSGDSSSFYLAKTAPFARIRDSDALQIGAGGLLLFHGVASHFVDLFLMVSRDRQDSADLSTLLRSNLQSEDVKAALAGLVGLAVAAPQVAAVVGAISAAGILGDFAYRLLRAATGNTIGLYRNSYLEYRDGFGIGVHPGPGRETFRVNDLSFRYEISQEG
jgi:hypothetical protein